MPKLKTLQQRLASLLNKYFEEINKDRRSLSHGFRVNHSIATNAEKHKNRRYVFNVDLQDFFPSINFGRVRGFFIKDKDFQLAPKVATILAQIACHDNQLPQGSPCSPIISNLIGHILDMRLVHLAKEEKCTYSRYADDLTFSTNQRQFPSGIAVQTSDNQWQASEQLLRTIQKAGFSLNAEKTSMQFKASRQMATGLVVNQKVNVKREFYRTTRSMCHRLFTTGDFEIEGGKPAKTLADKLQKLRGRLDFVYHIKRNTEKLGARNDNPNAITQLYRKFLFYEYFFSAEMPVIFCEGKTDITYLQSALKSLAASYPHFISSDHQSASGVSRYKVKFFMTSGTISNFALASGTGGLLYLIQSYDTIFETFKGDGKKQPVIIVVDNDQATNGIKKKLSINQEDKPKIFYHYKHNLYVVFAPREQKGKAIEHLFEQDLRDTKLDGKSLNLTNEKCTENEYSKYKFAKEVVERKWKDINFDGFKEIFDAWRAICKDYQNTLQQQSSSEQSVQSGKKTL